MTPPRTPFTAIARACWMAGALGWLWAFLAQQPVGSTLWVRGLPQAIDRFALHAWVTGFAVHLLAPRMAMARGRRALVAVTAFGCALSLGALAASAATGLRGVMWSDPRSGAGWLFMARALGGALLLGALVRSWTVRVDQGQDA